MPREKPTGLKLISGTTRRDRPAPSGLQLPMLETVPRPPAWLPMGPATDEWGRLAPQLVACRVLPAAGTTALAHLCAVHAALLRQYESGAPLKAALLAQYRILCSEFGLTPLAQGKLLPARASTPTKNAFSGRGQRP